MSDVHRPEPDGGPQPGRAGRAYDPDTVYRERRSAYERARDGAARRARRIGTARVGTFVAAFGLLLAAELDAFDAPGLWTAMAAAAGILFVAFVAAHRRVRRTRDRFDALRRENEEALRRRARDWDRLPRLPTRGPGPDHPHADDLDLFGHASLSHLLGPVGTVGGRERLARWLCAPADPTAVVERQGAVADLVPRLRLREELAARARQTPRVEPDDIEAFLGWAEEEPWLRARPALLWAVRLIPPALVVLGWLRLTGAVDGHWWVIPFGAGLALTRRWRDRIRSTLSRAFAREGVFHGYPGMFRAVVGAEFEAERLRSLRGRLADERFAADRAMRRLERMMVLAEARHSSFHGIIHAITLWDFQVVARLETWQHRAGRRARGWFDALSELEALAAFARLAHAEPGWTFPDVAPADGPPTIRARELAHPLLAPHVRVPNDVDVGPPGTFLFVTGSNMSGKSTLLRSIGTNAVLAQAGAPVSASELRLPPVSVHTSIRLQDSLARGVSYFLAELQRLRQIVEAARRLREDRDERTLLYLIDEMLQGTNADERRIAARRILRHLLDLGAIGAVTTHDLRLVDSPALESGRRAVHFRETIAKTDGRTTMSFDYRLRPGPATSRNALELMRAVGLTFEEAGDD
ncbi:MAG: MutS-related protein [Gemmatimonadota bacterium]